MTRSSHWNLTPRQSIEAECGRRGEQAVVAGCIRLLAGKSSDDELLLALGGPGATKFLDGRTHTDLYWLRVWGARGLLWVWDDSALTSIKSAMSDEAWRVREMAAKVVAKHLLGDALPQVAELRSDSVARVRAAAHRAVTLLTQAGA